MAATRSVWPLDAPASAALALEPASATVGAGALTDDVWSDTDADVVSVETAGGSELAGAVETAGGSELAGTVETAGGSELAAALEAVAAVAAVASDEAVVSDEAVESVEAVEAVDAVDAVDGVDAVETVEAVPRSELTAPEESVEVVDGSAGATLTGMVWPSPGEEVGAVV